MNPFDPTVIVRHQKERIKKCSLHGLEQRADLCFYSYPLKKPLPVAHYVLLSVDAEEILSSKDCERGLLLLDGTWKLSKKMESTIDLPNTVVRRSLPNHFQTAYPRRQDEMYGLASIEALYIAYLLTGRHPEGLLEHYYWKELFLEKNHL